MRVAGQGILGTRIGTPSRPGWSPSAWSLARYSRLAPEFLGEAADRLVVTGSGAIQSGVSRAVCYKYLIR